eukprot:CAMPEP_0119071112 /NCGR_PEP_ID=MMETSP1178-20130426/48458_1 /TAXON_ID=33656 /ORGANISM="unid sp, Strain CCMP2000" /LENGTH=149 /DNA_ID=CAMNT_0007053011 /DNA_START=53 /DNA_END=502 /DNA_ORIENTATION=+
MSSSLLTEEDRQELRAIFDALDHNSDGMLEVDEVAAILKSFGSPMTEAEVLDMVTELKPELKKLPFEDFVSVMCRPMVSQAALVEEVKEVFGQFAGSGNSAITAASLQEAMASLDHPVSKLVSEEMIREADLDRDGKVGMEDFMRTVVL